MSIATRLTAASIAALVALPVLAAGAPKFAVEGKPAYDVGIPQPSEPKAFFLNVLDGATVSSPVTLEFGLVGMMVAPAGQILEGYGHHHLLIDTTADSLEMGAPIPLDASHLHFGAGQRRVTLELPEGTHTIQLVMGDGYHTPLNPMVKSEPITVTVE